MAKLNIKKSSDKLNEIKKEKNKELSNDCHDAILNGFDYQVNNTVYHFSYDTEAQSNFQETYQLFQNNVVESVKWSARRGDGSPVRLSFDKAGFEQLFYASVKHKQENIAKLKDELEPILDAQTTKEGVEAITWDGESVDPAPVGIVLKTEETMDKELVRLEQKNEQTDMALMEIAMQVMWGSM